jgi:hypothetical protein
MKVFLYRLTRMDGEFITERTGKSSVICFNQQKIHRGRNSFMYHNEDCISPGVSIYVSNLEQIGDEYRFFNAENIEYKAEFLEIMELI